MPELRPFVSKDVQTHEIPDPPGVLGLIASFIPEVPFLFVGAPYGLELLFPHAPDLMLSRFSTWRLKGQIGSNVFDLERVDPWWKPSTRLIRFKHEGVEPFEKDSVRLGGMEFKASVKNERFELRHKGDLVWTIRRPWKASDPACVAMVFVPQPERWGDKLDLLLFLALNLTLGNIGPEKLKPGL